MKRVPFIVMAAFAFTSSMIAGFVPHVSLKINRGTLMRRTSLLKLILILVSLLVTIRVANANWYAGNFRSGIYGMWATIFAPGQKPYMIPTGISGQSHWVSLSQPNWIQAGWHVYWYEADASSYWEICTNGCFGLNLRENFGTHAWGYPKEYLIEYRSDLGPNRWCAYIGGVQAQCEDVTSAPAVGQVNSEVHYSSDNKISTTFSEVRYRNAASIWSYMDQNNYAANFPYGLNAYSNYAFYTYRKSLAFLPFMIK